MTEERIREAGRRLADAWLAARPADTYPDALRARSRSEAYAIQDAMAAEIFLGEFRCEPIEALEQAAAILGERGIAIDAGQYVSTGAATDPRPVRPGSVVQARFGTLGVIDIVFTD